MIDRATRTLILQTSALALRRVELRLALRTAPPGRRDAYERELAATVIAHEVFRAELHARLGTT